MELLLRKTSQCFLLQGSRWNLTIASMIFSERLVSKHSITNVLWLETWYRLGKFRLWRRKKQLKEQLEAVTHHRTVKRNPSLREVSTSIQLETMRLLLKAPKELGTTKTRTSREIWLLLKGEVCIMLSETLPKDSLNLVLNSRFRLLTKGWLVEARSEASMYLPAITPKLARLLRTPLNQLISLGTSAGRTSASHLPSYESWNLGSASTIF